MTPSDPEVRWSKGADLAEYAEALNVPTNHIMAVRLEGRDALVLYTPTLPAGDEAPHIFEVTLRRDNDKVLHAIRLPVEVPGMWDTIVANVEHSLRDKFGRPPK